MQLLAMHRKEVERWIPKNSCERYRLHGTDTPPEET